VHDHLEESDGRYTDRFKVVRVFGPGTGGDEGLVGLLVVSVEGIALGVDEFDRVLELCMTLAPRSSQRGIAVLTPGLLCSLHDGGLVELWTSSPGRKRGYFPVEERVSLRALGKRNRTMEIRYGLDMRRARGAVTGLPAERGR